MQGRSVRRIARWRMYSAAEAHVSSALRGAHSLIQRLGGL